jgi:hypothetical protein
MRVVLAKGVYKKSGIQMVTVKWADGKNSSVEGVKLFDDM